MKEIQFISSLQNQKIKQLVLLQQKSSERKRSGLFVVEGLRELRHCVSKGYEIDSLFFCSALLGESIDDLLVASSYEVTEQVYGKIAYRDSTEGVVAVMRMRHTALEELQLSDRPLLVVLESVEKPGNLGAVLRSADAAGADAVISEACIRFLKERGIRILTAQLQDSELYYDTDMTCGTAIVMGTEATGLTNQWREAADAHIRIPMLGQLDSLNVSVSAAILLFEAVRQREGNH